MTSASVDAQHSQSVNNSNPGRGKAAQASAYVLPKIQQMHQQAASCCQLSPPAAS